MTWVTYQTATIGRQKRHGLIIWYAGIPTSLTIRNEKKNRVEGGTVVVLSRRV